MAGTRWTRFLTIGLIALGLAACGGEGGDAPAAPAPDESSAALDGSAAGAEENVEAPASDAEVEAEAPASSATPKPAKRSLVEQGQRRTVGFQDAVEKLTFVPYEPAELPQGATRTVVHLIQPIEGIENPALPAVRFIYDVAGSRSLILVQSIARGELGEGEEVEVAGTPARLEIVGDTAVLVFERDGINVELRGGGLSRNQLLAVAESLVPYTELEAAQNAAGDDASTGEGEDSGAAEETSDDASSEGDAGDDGSTESSDG